MHGLRASSEPRAGSTNRQLLEASPQRAQLREQVTAAEHDFELPRSIRCVTVLSWHLAKS